MDETSTPSGGGSSEAPAPDVSVTTNINPSTEATPDAEPSTGDTPKAEADVDEVKTQGPDEG